MGTEKIKVSEREMIARISDAIRTARASSSPTTTAESFRGMSVSLAGTYSVTLAYNSCNLPGDEGIVAFAHAAERIAHLSDLALLNPTVKYRPYSVTYSW